MALDSATPGRMAITYYRELQASEFLERIRGWHEHMAWPQNLGKDRRVCQGRQLRAISQRGYGLRTWQVRWSEQAQKSNGGAAAALHRGWPSDPARPRRRPVSKQAANPCRSRNIGMGAMPWHRLCVGSWKQKRGELFDVA